MASKKYAYYNKGNKIGIIQKDTSDINSDDYSKYKSPVETVTNGLEIEYSYAPIYNFSGQGDYGNAVHRFVGYGSDGTNLLFITMGHDDVEDLSSKFNADQKIYVDSGPWEGVHELKSAGSDKGILTTKTLFNATPNKLDITVNWTTEELFAASNEADKQELALFKDQQSKYPNKYVFIQDGATQPNNGIFSLTSGASESSLYFDQQYHVRGADDSHTTNLNDIVVTAAETSSSSSDAITMYNLFYSPVLIYENIDVIQDESFELDLTRYQANAIVYYLKAKAAEDMMDIEKFEYYMTSFRKQMKKAAGSRKRGPYISQGFWNMK